METNSNVKTNVAIPPRMLLKDELSARGMSQRQLATIHGWQANTMRALMSGKSPSLQGPQWSWNAPWLSQTISGCQLPFVSGARISRRWR